MRKQLLAGTALAAATMLVAGGAVAADKNSMAVGGYYNVIVGGFLDETQETSSPSGSTSTKADTSGLDVRTNAEVHFKGSATLDNGIKIATRVELEGQSKDSATDPIDEYFVSLSGMFGQIIIGGTSGVPTKMIGGYSGTGAGVGAHNTFDNWTANPGKVGTYIAVGDEDSEKIIYISPSFGGFQVGMAYSPEVDETTGNARVNADAALHDGLGGAVRYSGQFGDVGFGVGASLLTVQGANDDNTVNDQQRWSVGGYLDFGGGFRVGTAHKRVDDDSKAAQAQITDVGIRFVAGSNKFSLVGVYGEMDNSDATRTTVVGSYARTLGPGVAAHGDLMWSEAQGDKSADGEQKKADGLVLLTGLKVSF